VLEVPRLPSKLIEVEMAVSGDVVTNMIQEVIIYCCMLLFFGYCVRKLTRPKINLIIQLSMYRNNDLLAVNMNNISTT
jgi:hypothetical protein